MMTAEPQEQAEKKAGDEPAAVSVVVPSYNHAPFVAATLQSIIKQSFRPLELLVIDDGSTDESVTIIEHALNDCPFPCELLARDNRGLCATLNEGLERTSGDYFAYLGSDDLWLPEFLNARVGLLESTAASVLAYGHTFIIDKQNRIIDSTADWADYADGDAREMLLHTTAPMNPTVVYRRAALNQQRWDEASALEDYDLYLRLSAEGDFSFDPRVLSAWRRHATNVSCDQTLMLEEQLKAQRRAAMRFGFTDEQVETLQMATTFRRAEDFLRVGKKSEALRMVVRNLRGVSSSRTTAKILLRLMIPNSVMRRRERFRQRKAHERYGTIDI